MKGGERGGGTLLGTNRVSTASPNPGGKKKKKEKTPIADVRNRPVCREREKKKKKNGDHPIISTVGGRSDPRRKKGGGKTGFLHWSTWPRKGGEGREGEVPNCQGCQKERGGDPGFFQHRPHRRPEREKRKKGGTAQELGTVGLLGSRWGGKKKKKKKRERLAGRSGWSSTP